MRKALDLVVIATYILAYVGVDTYFLPGRVFYQHNSSLDCVQSVFQPASGQTKDLFSDWCRVYRNLSNCARDSEFHFFQGVKFDQDAFIRNGEYLCELFNDIEEDVDCVNLEQIGQTCEEDLERVIHNNGTILSADCIVAEQFEKCYENKLKEAGRCPRSVDYFFLKFTTVYVPAACTAHGHSQTDMCGTIGKLILPENETDLCFKDTRVVRECLEREQPYSKHLEDRVQAQYVNNYTRYEVYRNASCRLLKETDISCKDGYKLELEECSKGLGASFYGRLKKNKNITSSELCGMYTDLMTCNTRVMTDCTLGADFFNLLACASSPSTCPCPVNLQVTSGGYVLESATSCFLFVSVLILIIF